MNAQEHRDAVMFVRGAKSALEERDPGVQLAITLLDEALAKLGAADPADDNTGPIPALRPILVRTRG